MDEQAVIDSIENIYGIDLSLEFVIIISIFLAMNVAPLIALINLMIFHIWLYFKKLSTFEFIMQKRERAEELKLKIQQIKADIQIEEAKLSNANNIHMSVNSTEQNMRKTDRPNDDQKTKGSTLDVGDENSKGSLFPNGKLVIEAESHKDNIFEEDDEDNDSKGQETDFRNTA